MKVAIYGRTASAENIECVKILINTLLKFNIDFIFYKSFADILITEVEQNLKTFTSYKQLKEVNFVLSIGGDGTLLRSVKLVRDSEIPILGINTGRLGYLANTTKSEITNTIQQLTNKEFTLDKRTLVKLSEPHKLFGKNYALNEIVISKKDSSSMITIHTYLDDEYLSTFWADGLILSTPTGSTGYSLSCGGPIILPTCNDFIITPIAPHNLTVRPLIIPDNRKIKLKIESRESKILVSLDGYSKSIKSSEELTIEKEAFTVNLISLKNHSHLTTLRNKLMWGADNRN